jgi:hypothetical protein
MGTMASRGMTMLRIYFTSEDVARTRIASRPDPLWELMLAVQMLNPHRGDLLFTGWRREATEALRRANLGPPLNLLRALNPSAGYFPDFLNPIEALHGLEHGLEAVRSTPKQMLRRDMRELARSQRLPTTAHEVADGNPRTLTELTDTMRACHDLLLAPYWRRIETAIDRDRSTKMSTLADGGVEALLACLRPLADWSDGELRVPAYCDQELHLAGRGLLLIPSYFIVNKPLTMLDPALPPVLVYPVERPTDTLPVRDTARPEALGALIGPTRAAVLQAISTNPRTTEELARRAGISSASASEHSSVLRRSGLVTSSRDRNRMQHRLTALGLALLHNR